MSKKRSGKNILVKILILVLTICVIGGVFFAAYQIMAGKTSTTYTSTLKTQKKAVDSANEAAAEAAGMLASISEGDKDNLSQIEDAFTSAEAALKKAINATKEISIPAKYQTQYEQLLAGMDNNKKLYTQALLILKNPASSDRNAALEDLGNYISNAASCYYKGDIKGIKIELPNDILALQGTIDSYTESIYKQHQGKLDKLNEYKSYYDSMADLIKSFKNEKIDLSTNFRKVASNQATVSDVYSSIEKKLLSLTKISTDYKALSAPAVAGDVHGTFNNVVKTYIAYCEDYENALLKYKDAGSNEALLAECSVTLTSLDNQYVNISNSFDSFITKFNDSKEKNTNIETLE